MKFEAFQAGSWVQQYEYQSFSPTPVNHEWSWEDPRINALLEQASTALAQLDAFSHTVPDVDRFIFMHVAKEANTSSRIEGTRTEIDEVVMDKVFVASEKRDDWQEVHNYIRALNTAIEELERLPLSNRLLRQTHAILMDGVRGERKTPGEFRRSQNWIGGASLADAVFIPPHWDELSELMSDLERFLHNEQLHVPHLVRVAIAHYQFETIHPFLDGNGRIGRLLIPLYLIDKGLLQKPSLYLSAYLEKHKGLYYDSLMQVRASSDMGQWVRFFLQAVLVTAERGKETFKSILSLRDEVHAKAMSLGRRAQKALLLLERLYAKPMVTGPEAAEVLDVTLPTAHALIRDFQELGILQEASSSQRGRHYAFVDYLNLFHV